MDRTFYMGNRQSLYDMMDVGSMAVIYSGHAPRKTADEPYPFFADRSFVYLTGLQREGLIFTALKSESVVEETLFILPPDAHAERWTGKRVKAAEAEEISGIKNYKYVTDFAGFLKFKVKEAFCDTVCLDFDKYFDNEPASEAYLLAREIQKEYPYVKLCNIHKKIAHIRTIKKPCEIEAMRKAELITRDGILAMMKASKPGMYEYQYKAEFDYALAQHGVLSPMFPSIISAGKNNFCIHYYDYRGQAQDGDMILNDVGAVWDNCGNDVSRGWPCNGKFNDRQRALYECAYNTSNYMFSVLKPGIPMNEVDLMARKFNFEQLKGLGLLEKYEDAGKLIWHGGAHHVGFDTHDVVDMVGRKTEPGMVFCVDIGIYCEEWGIGFRLEDNCLITEDGCENLSVVTPRSIEDIENVMR
ncbi:MAG: aminopeptidase P N-terminal domain-containing protein [Clostridia bacterium]|nr:aminopeptidase P N-terminal domain-containing protein [Clostridia bacterium]